MRVLLRTLCLVPVYADIAYTEVFRLLVKMKSAKCRVHSP